MDPTTPSNIIDAASKIKPKNNLDVMKYTINDIATPTPTHDYIIMAPEGRPYSDQRVSDHFEIFT